ncbi:MAG: hypothetical protein ACLVJO_14700 [[Clostridium] scindens]
MKWKIYTRGKEAGETQMVKKLAEKIGAYILAEGTVVSVEDEDRRILLGNNYSTQHRRRRV